MSLVCRSKKETERLHQLHKPVRKPVEDDLPSVNSHSEDEDDWSSGISDVEDLSEDEAVSGTEEHASSDAESSNAGAKRKRRRKHGDSDEEMPFESRPRKRRPSWEPESDKEKGIERLPIKLADGRVQKSTSKVFLEESEDSGLESDEGQNGEAEIVSLPKREDVTTGARFGRLAVVDVIGQKSRKARIQGAKEQIAGICQEILGDPENSVCAVTLSSHVTDMLNEFGSLAC